jgi:hypothetical protein
MPILFGDIASVFISRSNLIKFKNTINEVYGFLDDWFKKELNAIKYNKTYYLNVAAKNKVKRDH